MPAQDLAILLDPILEALRTKAVPVYEYDDPQRYRKELALILGRHIPDLVSSQVKPLGEFLTPNGDLKASHLRVSHMIGLLNIARIVKEKEDIFASPNPQDDSLVASLMEQGRYQPRPYNPWDFPYPGPIALRKDEAQGLKIGFSFEGMGTMNEVLNVAAMTGFLIRETGGLLKANCLVGDSERWFTTIQSSLFPQAY